MKSTHKLSAQIKYDNSKVNIEITLLEKPCETNLYHRRMKSTYKMMSKPHKRRKMLHNQLRLALTIWSQFQ